MPGACDTCGYELDELRVYALPGVPVTVANCDLCTAVNAYPYGILVANTTAVDGLEHAADWWKGAVFRSLAVIDKTMREFLLEVEEAKREMEEMGRDDETS